MGTIQCGFWNYRFFVTPTEFAKFIDICDNEKFSFFHCDYAGKEALIDEVKKTYCLYYYYITGKKYDSDCKENTYASVVYSLRNPNFNGGLSIVSNNYGNIKFVAISSPKAYAVTSDDGKYFSYEDILKREPRAKEVFDILVGGFKKITKPLYENGKPVYSIRISKDAWNDLKSNLCAEGLSTKW